MSRCFPFPPPGYTKKPRPEDLSLLKEDKQKEKKHKKEKKDKEKRESKEKRDKERSDGKHKDKKDRKEKHRDKKDKHKEKKKERRKVKDKTSTSETSKITGLSEAKGVEKLNTEGEKDNSSFAEEKYHAAQSCGQNGDRNIESNFVARKTEESKFAQELDKRIRVEKITENELVEKFSSLDRKKDEEAFTARNPGNLAEDKGKSREKQFDNKKMDGQGYNGGNSMVHNLSGTTKGKGEGIPKVEEKNDERRLGEKEKTKERRDDIQGDKRKDKDRDKRSGGNDKDREKERKKEKVKEKSEHKKSDLEKSKDNSRSGLIGVIDNKSAFLSLDLHNNANVEGNLKKRKDVDINGFLHDTEVRSNKLQRPTSHQVVENGQKLGACQIPSLRASDRQAVAAMLRVDENEGRKNGRIESLPLPATKPKSSSATADVDQIAAVSRKPPHPDSKYLSQVLSVPKMDEWSEFDDQEWLFTSQDSGNTKVGATGVAEEPQVWSEALHIESADVVALPYVIPY